MNTSWSDEDPWAKAGWRMSPPDGQPHPWPAPQTDSAPRHSRRLRLTGSGVALALGFTALGVAAGAGVGRLAWQQSSSPAATGVTGPGAQSFGSGNGFPGQPSGSFPGYPGSSSGSSGPTSSSASDGPKDAATIAKDVDPGLVDITTTLGYEQAEAAGTGMVLTSSGEILTNNHVIDGATAISVRDVGNNRTYSATVVGYDRSADVAVLQLKDASGLTTVTTATSEPSTGAAVVGIGNAGGTGGTPSYAGGAVTQTGASITASDESDGTSEKLTGLLGTDADIQAGDSGGPMVNTSGQVVGMDTAASANYSFSQAGSSQGYAIPIVNALEVAGDITAGEASSAVHLGATAMLGVEVSTQAQVDGAAVEQVIAGEPAAKAGIAAGDVITALDGHTVSSAEGLTQVISTQAPGGTVDVTWTGPDGSSHSGTVTFSSGPPQ